MGQLDLQNNLKFKIWCQFPIFLSSQVDIPEHDKMSVPRARLLDLMKVCIPTPIYGAAVTNETQVQCQIFSSTFNPEGIRTGNKVLRQRLRGPALAAYYPRKVATVRDLIKEFEPLHLTTEDEEEDDRLEAIAGYAFH